MSSFKTVVDRAKWLRGEDNSYLLRPDDQLISGRHY